MQKKIIVGNLGADAELKTENGRQFVSMSIANTERRKKDDGTYTETTTWVSATLNGDGGNLLQYLKKGAKVYAYGDYTVRMYHSEKQRALVAGVNLYIRDIELLSTNTDAVPRDLYDETGAAHRITKYYWVQDAKKTMLYDRNGAGYLVDEQGFVWPPNNEQPAQEDQASSAQQSDVQQADDAPFTSEPVDTNEDAAKIIKNGKKK